jgi:hypothetical protein
VRIQSYPGNISDVWSAIDVQVHASSIDSLPNAIIEGMSSPPGPRSSRPSARSGSRRPGRTGLVVPPGDPSALAPRSCGACATPRCETARRGGAAATWAVHAGESPLAASRPASGARRAAIGGRMSIPGALLGMRASRRHRRGRVHRPARVRRCARAPRRGMSPSSARRASR